MSAKKYEFTNELFDGIRGGVYVIFPFSAYDEFGKRGTIRVICTIDNYKYKCSLLPIGNQTHAIHVRKDVRKIIKKDSGDEVFVTIELDLSPQVLIIPEDFQWFLDDDHILKQKFENLSFSNKSAIINYIDEAKLPETRANRINNFIERIHRGFIPGG